MASEKSLGHLGDLGRLPNELLWQILDQVVMDTPRLTHAGMCGLYSLMKTNQANGKFIQDGYMTDERKQHILVETNSLRCYADLDDATDALGQSEPEYVGGEPGEEPDLFTGIIRDDCLECFSGILGSLPEFPMMCHNEKGWSFFALAVEARSMKLLQQFVTSKLPAHTREFLFSKPHPGSRWTMSNLGFAAVFKDADTFTALFQHLQNTMDPTTFKMTIESKLTDNVKGAILRFMTPALQSMLDQGGIVIELHQSFYHG
jgi:hypothetical protein